MKKLFDLHLHSVFSDGKKKPREICAAAKAAGLDGFALTDHDTVAGLKGAAEEAGKAGLFFIPGIEVSAYDGCEIHILGLGIDYSVPDFLSALDEIRRARDARNSAILKKLDALNIHITEEEIAGHGRGSSGRGQIARAMAAKGYAPSARDAFNVYLDDGGLADCGNVCLAPQKAIDLIYKGKGKTFLAHPGRLNLNDKKKFLLIDKLVEMGLEGIEAYYPKHSRQFTEQLLEFACTRKLSVCGGTDNHGNEGDLPIGGIRVPCPPL